MTLEQKIGMDEDIAKIEALEKDIEKVCEELKETLGDSLSKALRILDDRNYIKELSFEAYTPYFNDGDACTYVVYSDTDAFSIIVNLDASPELKEFALEEDTWEFHDLMSNGDEYEATSSYLEDIVTKVSGLVDNIPPNYILAVFGDHSKICITKNGTRVNECVHD